ncbi:MAG TPA: redoxin domain-containing protein [Thermoanaerobaculia bacterium]|nr:redoxin domain-containing protein [Thermoanaerobaculia bacterium]
MRRMMITLLLSITLAAAARAEDLDKLRAMQALQDHEGIMHEPMPTTPEGRAIRILALYANWVNAQAKREGEALVRELPNDPWALAVQANEVGNAVGRSDEMVAVTGKMLAAAPRPLPDRLLRSRSRALQMAGRMDEARALLDKLPVTSTTRVERANILQSESFTRKKPELMDQAIALLEEGRKADPGDVALRVTLGRMLGSNRKQWDKALEVLREAAALTPSLRVHDALWDALAAQRNMTTEQKNAAIDADIASLPAERRDWPETRLALSRQYRDLKLDDKAKEIEDAIFRDTPESYAAEQVLWNRYIAALRAGTGEKTPEQKAESRRLLRAMIDYPHHASAPLVAAAYESLFYLLNEDPATTNQELLNAVRHMELAGEESPDQVYGAGARALADRGIELAYAEELARKAVAGAPRVLADEKTATSDPAELAQAEAYINGGVHDTLGWVLLQKGDAAGAKKELLAAYELLPASDNVVYHLGQYYERRGQLAKAEEMYRKGTLLQTARKNKSPDALKALYQKRNGSLKGYEAYMATLKDKDANARRTRILASKIRSPKAAPPFALATLEGGKRALGDLKGKVAVINFWGIWCSWCVREMPDYQALVKKYAKDPKVAVFTVNNDPDLEKVKTWMKEQQYDFDVLVDDGWVGRQSVHGFPTTWFIDPKGRLAFEKHGWSEKLVEEFSWRIDALKE